MVGRPFEVGPPWRRGKDRELSLQLPATTIDPQAAKAVPDGEILAPAGARGLVSLGGQCLRSNPRFKPRRLHAAKFQVGQKGPFLVKAGRVYS
jgi:hypothetical protein